MRSRSVTLLVLSILFLLVAPIVLGFNLSLPSGVQTHVLAATNGTPYNEKLSLYLTSGETFWKADLTGGNTTVSSLSIPQSVSSYSITLTHFDSWKSQYEIFTTYGFGLLGPNEPSPNGAFLTISTTSTSDAQSLVNSLDQRFGLVFEPTTSTSGSFSYFSPLDFNTVMHVYFWKLVPTYYGGFASLMTEQQFEQSDLSYYELNYSSTSGYSISLGGLKPLVALGAFTLYSQLGLTQNSYNYSSTAQSSEISIEVLGGLISNASIPFSNNYSNFSASMSTTHKPGSSNSSAIPNINATLDLSFPTILAYRQISTLSPSQNGNVSVTIFIRNVSPSGMPAAQNVDVNDSWIYSEKSNFNLTGGQTALKENLTAGQTTTLAYSFKVLGSNGTFEIPATPVTYQFSSANRTVTAHALLNPETIVVGSQNTPLLEATESLSSGTIQAGQTISVNVTISNKGSGTALNVEAGGMTKENLPQGSSWSFVTNTTSSSLTQTNATLFFPVTWKDANNVLHNTTTNSMSAVFSFSTPSTPALSISKTVSTGNSSKVANVTLTLIDDSPNALAKVTVKDPLPSGVQFGKSYDNKSLRFLGGVVVANVTSLAGHQNQTFVYSVNITNTNENYVFMPAAGSTVWNNLTIVHYSNGYGLPLGVEATKQIEPSQGFQGSNVTVSVGLVNKGSLPIYNVNLGDTHDSFLNILSGNSTFQATLESNGAMNATFNANLTGTPGTYESSTAGASFLFAGVNKTAQSNTFSVTIYRLVQASISYSPSKLEENHNIDINVTITNPSNVTVTNVMYTMTLPSGLKIQGGGTGNVTIASLGPNKTATQSFVVQTNQPDQYNIPQGSLAFQYQGHVLRGVASGLTLNVGDDLTTRYGIPIVIGIVIALAMLLYVRRLVRKT